MSSPARPVVGVVGLGRMGRPIAARLVRAGLAVVATDRERRARAYADTIGATWVPDVGRLAAASEVVITVLPGPSAVLDVIAPITADLAPAAAWIDMTSATPDVSEAVRAHAAGGIRTLECPVGGSPDAAATGDLLGYLGARADDRTALRWLLDLLCRELVHVGAPGSGYAAKLLVNLLWFGQAVAVAEVLALGTRVGLDPRALRDTLRAGPAASRFLERDAGALLRGDDMATFALARCVEEIAGALDLAREQGLSPGVAERVGEIYEEALHHFGDVDGELLAARRVTERLGVRYTEL